MLAAFGMGGYSPALFILFTGSFLAVLYFLAAGNLSRGFRSTDLADCAGGRRRMPSTTLAPRWLGRAGDGLSLNTYGVLSSVLRNATPSVGPRTGPSRWWSRPRCCRHRAHRAYAFRVSSSSPPANRCAGAASTSAACEVDARLRRTAIAALAGAAGATIVGLPGADVVLRGRPRDRRRDVPRFVFYGARHQDLGVSTRSPCCLLGRGGRLGGASAGLRAGCLPRDARLSRSSAPHWPGRARARRADAGGARRRRRPGRCCHRRGTLDTLEVQLLDPIPAAMGESCWGSEATRSPGCAALASACAVGGLPLAVLALLLAASVLAATGHFPVTIQ